MRTAYLLPIVLSIAFPACASIETGRLGDVLSGPAPLDEATAADGLREALTVGIRKAGNRLSTEGGFSDDPLLRIALPKELDNVASRLRSIGLGDQVDAFETTMNRAAERAAGESFEVFAEVIRSLTIEDAFTVLDGPPDAATSLFRKRASDELRNRFTPVVESAMGEVGLYSAWETLVDRYNSIPLVPAIEFDLDAYIVDEAVSGLFTALEAEEARIRRDPVARTTALLQRVFGSSRSRQE